MSAEPATLEEMTRNVTSDAVATARHNLNHEYEFFEKRLAGLPVTMAGSLLSMLQTAFNHRQQAMQLAIEEHKYSTARKHQEEQARLQAKAELEAAPKLERPVQ
jgi:hypothetical protein